MERSSLAADPSIAVDRPQSTTARSPDCARSSADSADHNAPPRHRGARSLAGVGLDQSLAARFRLELIYLAFTVEWCYQSHFASPVAAQWG